MYRLDRLVFVLIRVLRLWFPGRDDACSGPCYRPLKHGFFVEGFYLLDELLNRSVELHPSFLTLRHKLQQEDN